MKRGPIIECWCCGHTRHHDARGLCHTCYMRWRRHGFTGNGPGPSRVGRMHDYTDDLTTHTLLTTSELAQLLGVQPYTIRRWRHALQDTP